MVATDKIPACTYLVCFLSLELTAEAARNDSTPTVENNAADRIINAGCQKNSLSESRSRVRNDELLLSVLSVIHISRFGDKQSNASNTHGNPREVCKERRNRGSRMGR